MIVWLQGAAGLTFLFKLFFGCYISGMKELVLWGTVLICSAAVYWEYTQFDTGVVQGVMMLVINSRFRLYQLTGLTYLFGLIFEALLSVVSAVMFYYSPAYTVVFWVYFSSVNKFAVEDPINFGVYGKYFVYTGYSCGSVLFALSTRFKPHLLLRYGAFFIFIVLSAVGYSLACGERGRVLDLERFGVACMFCLCAGFSMIERNFFLVLPCIVVSCGLLVYEAIAFIIRLARACRLST